MSKIVVTGCAGFVGSWVCEKALAAGHEVIGIDNLSSGVNFTPVGVDFYKLDLNSNIESILNCSDAIVHAAARADVRHNWESKLERDRLFKNNEAATISVLEQMPSVPIVFLSTAAVYGSLSNNTNNILTEEDANSYAVESPYAASKLACESYIAAWSYKRKTPWYVFRLVNQVGSRGHHGVIYDFHNMIVKTKHIHALDNGEQRKNWVHVEDTADAIITVLDSKNNVPYGAYTITSNERWSWRDIVLVITQMYLEKNPNSKIPFTVTHENKLAGSVGDPVNLYVSGDKFKPYYSCNRSIETAIRQALHDIGW